MTWHDVTKHNRLDAELTHQRQYLESLHETTLALINRGDATAREILALANSIRGAVQSRFEISLELEPVIVGTVGFILIMVGRTGWDLLVYMGSFVTAVGIAVWLAPHIGMRGTAIAEAVTLTASAIVRLLLVKRFVDIWPFDRWYLRLIPATIAGGVTMWAVHQVLAGPKWLIDLGGSILAGTLVYGVVLLVTGLKPGERRAVLTLTNRLLRRTPAGV